MKARSSSTARILKELLALAHGLGREDRGLAILGEGNTSARTSSATFAVKASGLNLSSLSSAGLTECRFDALLPLLEARSTSDQAVERALLAARVDPRARKPSVEAMFHAYLLALPGVRFVGHTHPVAVNGLLCSDSARRFAAGRLFPDEIVCCGEVVRAGCLHRSGPQARQGHPPRSHEVHRTLRPGSAGHPAPKPRSHRPRIDLPGRARRHADGREGRPDPCNRLGDGRETALPVPGARPPDRRPQGRAPAPENSRAMRLGPKWA